MDKLDQAEKAVDLLSNIVLGNLVGFFMMVVAIVALGVVCWQFWKIVRDHMERCEEQHRECLEDNRRLAQAALASAQGHHHEARVHAQSVLERQIRELEATRHKHRVKSEE